MDARTESTGSESIRGLDRPAVERWLREHVEELKGTCASS